MGVALFSAENNALTLKLRALVIGYADGIEARDIELGLRVAQKAYDLTKGSNADICHAYAKMQFLAGKTTEAVELQKKAISLCTNTETAAEYRQQLQEYQQGEQKHSKIENTSGLFVCLI